MYFFSCATEFSRHGCWDDLETEGSFDSQATWVIDLLGLLLLSMGVNTTRHWQTYGRLLQELNVCTVPKYGTGYCDCTAGRK